MISAQSLQQYFHADYRGVDSILSEVLEPIFGRAERNNQSIIENNTDRQKAQSANIKEMLNVATLNPEGSDERIKVFDVTIEDNCHIHIARKGIQHLVREWIDRFEGAFIVFHYANPKGRSWRLSYLEKRSKNSDSTSAKRYTYLCGQDYPCRTIAERFSKLSPDNINSTILEEAFSAEALSTEFFTEYKNFYDDFVSYVTKDEEMFAHFLRYAKNDEKLAQKSIRDYIKKLMGRLVFIQFLQKKAWLNNDFHYMLSLFNSSTDKQKEEYLDNVLEPLFFGIFNTKKEDRPQLFKDNKWDKALLDKWADFPYLNGGLFECDPLDELRLPIPSYFFSNPQNKDVVRKPTDEYYDDACGIFDFFERYNFTIDESDPLDMEVGVDPEMLGKIFENLLEDNKDKGAFYTPKEIVQYMCREALIAYLVGEAKKKCETDELSQNRFEEDIRTFVTDPEMTVAQIAEHSDRQLLDLAESLEQVKICDPAIGSGAFPMGLLNLLVECREALNKTLHIDLPRYILKKDIILNNIYGVDIERGAIDIARLRFWLSIVVDLEKPEALPNFDYKFMQGNSLLEQYKGFDLSNLTKSKMTKVGNAVLSIFDDETDVLRGQLSEYMKSYYACSDHKEKADLYNRIRANVENQIAEGGMSVNLGGIDICANDQFFLWHTWFKDVFDQGGFDIVIGNPPYIRRTSLSNNEKVIYEKKYVSAQKQYDIYLLFIEQGTKLLNVDGRLCFINPLRFFNADYGVGCRKYLMNKRTINTILDISQLSVFANALTYPCVILIDAHNDIDGVVRYRKLDDLSQIRILSSKDYQSFALKKFTETDDYKFIIPQDETVANIIAKIDNSRETIGKYFNNARGLANNKVNFDGESCFALKSKSVKKYHVLEFSKISTDFQERFKEEMIILPRTVAFLQATKKEKDIVLLDRIYYLLPKDTFSINKLFILGVINAKVTNYWFEYYYSSSKVSGNYFDLNGDQISSIPIPPLSSNQQPIIDLVDQILAVKKSNPNADTSALENQIDELVYDLYGLTESEKEIVRKA